MAQSKMIIIQGKDGLRGTLDKPWTGETDQVLLKLEDGREVVVPVNALSLQKDGTYYLPLSLADLEGADKRIQEQNEVVIPLAAEQLDVSKREVVTGRVRINKLVREHQETVDEPLLREQVKVERVPVNRVVEQPASARQEGDTLIIPILEEVLVVEKRLMLKEEIHVTVQRTTVNEPQTVTLRSEEVNIERLDPHSSQT